MPDASDKKGGWLASMPNDSTAKILFMAISLCLICSIAVSTTAVTLRPLQERNAELAREWQILRVAGLLEEGVDQAVLFEQVELRFVDLRSGEFTNAIDAETFDLGGAARDPELSESISGAQDIAGIGVRMRYMPVYLVVEEGKLQTLVLPFWTTGLYGPIHGFLALRGDARTVRGITFYKDAETPGLGGEINNPRWQATWADKPVFDEDGTITLRVLRNVVDPDRQIDALSGATLTSRGVDNMVLFWMGEDGFGPLLANLQAAGGEI